MLLFRALVALALSAAIAELASTPDYGQLGGAKAGLSAPDDRPHCTVSPESARLLARVMPAPLSKRVPAPPTLHGLSKISARAQLEVGDRCESSSPECVAVARVRLWRRIPRMGPDEPPRRAHAS